MKAARLVVLGIALAAGGVAALLASGNRQPQSDAIDVLVAKADLSGGQVIAEPDIGWQAWPAAAASPTFIKQTDRPEAIRQFVGAIVRGPVATGEPIREPMAAILAPGMRAVSIENSPASGIKSDDRIDVLLTRRDAAVDRAGGTPRLTSETILENVRVLAVGGQTAMVELTAEQADRVTRSRQLGTLSLALHTVERRGPVNLVRYGVTTLVVPQN
jgi:pilus assembly protein CpaB